MYPQRDLNRLAVAKAGLRLGIAIRRVRAARAAAGVLRPLAWWDRARARWRRLAPFVRPAAWGLAFLVRRARASGSKPPAPPPAPARASPRRS
jgi:hypothetical protein